MSRIRLLQRIHRDECGAVTLETVLIIAAIMLPVLIFLIKFGWPRIRDLFTGELETLENEAGRASEGG